jgi:hypothetical protein
LNAAATEASRAMRAPDRGAGERSTNPATATTVACGVKRYEFHLRIPPGRYLEYYRGEARHVVARSTGGENVQFPASLLQRFLRPDGIEGRFVLTCDDNNKCLSLERIGGT